MVQMSSSEVDPVLSTQKAGTPLRGGCLQVVLTGLDQLVCDKDDVLGLEYVLEVGMAK